MARLDLSFDTGNVTLTRIQDAFASAYHYPETLDDDTPNPETKAQFARRMVASYIREIVVSVEHKAALAAIQPGDLDGDLKREKTK
jgi:hypothetical protein